MRIKINNYDIPLDNKEVAYAKKTVADYLSKIENICEKNKKTSLYLTIVIIMQLLSQNILDEYDGDTLKRIMEKEN